MRMISLVAATLLVASTALAQESRLDRLDEATRARVVSVVDRAGAQGLPIEPLIDKALEGYSKGASGDAIAAAVTRLHGALLQSRELLGVGASSTELTAAAGALRAGVAPNAIAALGKTDRHESLLVPLGVLADLVAMGIEPEMAARAVVDTAVNGATDADLELLAHAIREDIRAGVPPVTAASLRSGIPTALPPGSVNGDAGIAASREP